MELTSTIFGGKKLIHDGYIYIKDKDHRGFELLALRQERLIQ